jgi:hypothetical protein
MVIRNLRMGVTRPTPPTLAEIEQQRERLLTQADLPSRDYCSYSAAPLFGACVGDPIAHRILEALQAAENGLSRKQISGLFHGHVSSSSIDQALEELGSLGLATSRFVPSRGRPITLWSAVDHDYVERIEEEGAEYEEYPEEETWSA